MLGSHHGDDTEWSRPRRGVIGAAVRAVTGNLGFRTTLVLVAAAQLVAVKLLSPPVHWTGDEPRYLYYAASFAAQRNFSLSGDEWLRWLERHELPVVVDNVVGIRFKHSVVHSVALSPIVDAFGLAGGRWAQLLVGMLGFVGLLLLLERSVPRWAAAVALLFAFHTLPVQPYLTLLYAEIWLLALVALAWAGLVAPSFSWTRASAVLLACFAIPFVHLRGALVALGLFGFCVRRILRTESLRRRRGLAWALPFGGAACAAALFALYQLSLSGSLMGTALTPFTPSLPLYFDRLGVQLLESHHGLLASNPVWVLGLAGLVIGVAQRREVAIQGLTLVLLASIGLVWGTASESMPARFWVITVPALTVGLAVWLATLRSRWALLAAAPLVALSLADAILLLWQPNLFLENRTMSLTYDRIYPWTLGRLYLPAVLPWEPVELAAPHFEQARALIGGGLAALALALAGLAGANLARTAAVARVWSLVALAGVAIPLLRAHMTVAPPAAFEGQVATDEAIRLEIRFHEPSSARVVRLGDPPGWWPTVDPVDGGRPFPADFEISVRAEGADGFETLEPVPGRPILPIHDRRRLAAIRVTEREPTDGTWSRLPVTVLR